MKRVACPLGVFPIFSDSLSTFYVSNRIEKLFHLREMFLLSARGVRWFIEYSRVITATLDDVDDPTIKDSYNQFLKNMEQYVNQQSTNINKLSSMTIFKDFLDLKKQLFVGAEIAMQVVMCASVKISVESVVESLVSRYEGHFKKNRRLEENNALDEMIIAENGPGLFQAD